MKKKTFLFPVLFACILLSGGTRTLQSGPWTFSFDERTGFWEKVLWNGSLIFDNGNRIPPFDWGPGWPGGKQITQPALFGPTSPKGRWYNNWNSFQRKTTYRLLSWKLKAKGSALVLNYRIGDWDAVETIEFGNSTSPDCLVRTLRLAYNGSEPGPSLLANLIFSFPIAKDGRFFFPARGKDHYIGHQAQDLKTFPATHAEEAHGTHIQPFFWEKNGVTALFVPDPKRDYSNMSIGVRNNTAQIQANFLSYGYAYPGETQTLGPVHLKMFRGKLEHVFRKETRRILADLNLNPPQDRPDWVRDSVIYNFCASGSFLSERKDLGGFSAARTELLPRLVQLGFNTVWLLPVQDGPSSYWPRFFRKLNPAMGTAEEYRAFVEEAHRNRIRVLQDIIPHGGTPQFAAMRGNKPWELLYDVNGDALRYQSFDFGVPSWQKYMKETAQFYMREYRLDGLRIDVVDGSKGPNWRRKDLPSEGKVPRNVPGEWWKKELAAAGGRLPPLPYERASNTRRQGGNEMLRAIRSGVKSIRPDGAVLAEIPHHLPYTANADIVYDMPFCFQFCNNLLLREKPAEFVRRLSKWLEEQSLAEPEGILRLRYVECHDSPRTQGAIGLGAFRAMHAVMFFTDCVPLVFQDGDVGNGIFFRDLLKLRNMLPELRRGTAEYHSVKVSKEGVFSCLRRLEDRFSVTLVNLNPDSVEISVTIPEKSSQGKVNTLFDTRSGREFVPGKSRLKLAPWEYTVLADRMPEQLRSPSRSKESGTRKKRISWTRNSWEITVRGEHYSITIDRNGLISSMTGKGEKAILDKARIVYSSTLMQLPPHLYAVSFPSLEKTEDGCIIRSETVLPPGGRIRFVYRCTPQKVTMEAELSGCLERSVGIVFPAKEAEHWQVHTAEGMLDDLFTVRHRFGTPGKEERMTSRIQGTPIVWQSRMTPLDPLDPRISVFNAHGGISLKLQNPLMAGVDDVMVLDKLDQKEQWHAAFFWKNPEPGFPERQERGHFTVTFMPISEALPLFPEKNVLHRNSVRVSNESMNWRIENRHYRLLVAKQGGMIRSLGDRDGEIFRNSDFSVRGFSSPVKSSYSASSDTDTSVAIREENGAIRLRFAGTLRNGRQGALPPLRYALEYEFDSSPVIRTKWYFMAERIPEDVPFAGLSLAAERGVTIIPDGNNLAFTGTNGRRLLLSGKNGFEPGLQKRNVMIWKAIGRETVPWKWHESSLEFRVGK